MTTSQRNILRDLLQPAILLFLIGVFVQQIRWQEKMNNRMDKVEEHVENQVLHMPFDKTSIIFVPRVELDSRMNNMQHSLDKIEGKLDILK